MKNYLKISLLAFCIPAVTQAQWSLTGNAATDTAVNFVGTTDAKGLKIKTNNLTRVYVDKGGKVGIGTTDPQTALDLYSAATSTAFGIRSDGGSAFIFMDKQNATDNSTVSYRTNGTAVWQTGTFGNNDFAIKNLPLGNSITCLSSNNFVGIGTITPAERLDVNGNINTSGNLTATGTISAAGGNSNNWNTAFSWGNHALAGYLTSFTETDPQVSSIISNQVPKWNGTALVDGIITDNGSNVGIGTTIPAAKLDVKTNSNYVAQFNGAAPMYMGLFESDIYRGYLGSYAGSAEDIDFGTGAGNTTGKLHLTIQAVPKLTVSSNGNVGIGTVSPSYLLHVNGGDLFVQSSTGLIRFGYQGANEWQLATTGAGADLRWYTTTDGGVNVTPRHYFSQNGNVGIGGFNGPGVPLGRLDVISAGTTGSTNAFLIRNSSLDTIMRIRDDGRIGIGYNGVTYGRTINLGGTGMNFYTANEAAYGGSIFPTDTSLVLWSNSNSNNYLVMQPQWGNVGIGTYAPKTKLHVVNGTTASLTGGGYILAGSFTSSNIVLDNTSIMARANSLAATLNINNGSGNVIVCATGGGRLGVGASSPGGQLELGLDQGRKPSTNTWTIVSDARLKTFQGNYTKGLKEIIQLQPVLYQYKNAGERKFDPEVLKTQNVGFSAQEVQKIFPECVGKDDDGYLNFNMHAILVAQVNAIKELNDKVDTKDLEIADLKKQNADVINQLNEMKECLETLCTNSEQTKANGQQLIANSFLNQNNPNPFKENTTINFYISSDSGKGLLKIFSMNGEEIKSFIISSKGKGQIEIAGSTLSPGVYTYVLIVDDKTVDTKQMVVTR